MPNLLVKVKGGHKEEGGLGLKSGTKLYTFTKSNNF